MYRSLKPSQQKVNAEFEAREIVRQLSRLIPLYDDGRVSGDPQRILKYVEELKTTYGETDYCAQARKSWPGWFEGKVPPRGADQGQSGGYIRRDFDAAVARARECEKEWRFSEARETIETFLSTREATMNADDLALYRQEVKDQLTRIEGLADSVYRGQVQVAEKLVKNKRYDLRRSSSTAR